MRQLMFIEPGKLAWDEIQMPELLEPDDALVRPVVVARCDLDYAVFQGTAPFRGAFRHFLRNRLPRTLGQNLIFKKAPFAGPYPLGHECVAEVLEVGKDVTSAKPGQLVIVPFQISCGRCAMCRVGLTSACESVPLRSAYGLAEVGGLQWGGVLNDCVRVPFANHMLIPVPQGLEPVSLASVADNAPDGYRAVAEP
ncbi:MULTISPECIES: alcohol dehydrogenase catalytic domain-containing protein [unclassified Bradyrhizobium]|uniref:alcohol dehydrogenase catalytic domain-containing protein n=1 Tax=unclassified Bradyrhizobium TaxID=2631580 RepID=UPI002479A04F|nr:MULTISPECIES: alcohol dehydrogenase catalytic domain-containing protein [unclassified Bradyrhizobium]WGS19905.1 alcohol dehydrogenase catalytic domain-containing protein [Bradyrhizobium sp. ISRA463]WGS26758.1 alcohol dehydrogenase catalytic domain-containing protein [Bradyrhizobium sp. ISRA464]